ncbi:g6589 [Coccomyxa elongata]
MDGSADVRPCKRSSYTAYTRQGDKARLEDIVKAMEGADVVLLGETHDDRIAHLLQLQLLRGAHQRFSRTDRRVALSLEMFERDVQGIMDEYLSGAITERDLKQDGRPWPNYDTDYRPLVELAKAEGLPVICANAPRRYVSMAGRHGRAALETLPAASLRHLPPLPYLQPSQAYLNKTNRTMQAAAEQMEDLRSEQRRVDSATERQSEDCIPDVSAQGSVATPPEEGQHRCRWCFMCVGSFMQKEGWASLNIWEPIEKACASW